VGGGVAEDGEGIREEFLEVLRGEKDIRIAIEGGVESGALGEEG